MKRVAQYGIYHVYETADRDGPVWEVHTGTPPTALTLVHRGYTNHGALRIASALARSEEKRILDRTRKLLEKVREQQ